MARSSYSVTLGQSLGEGRYNTSTKGVPDPVTAAALAVTDAVAVTADVATVTADFVTVAANVATLVSDGATPTQAHVTTLNTNFGTLNTDFAALSAAYTTLLAAIAAAGLAGLGDASVSLDNAVLTSANARRAAIRALLRSLDADGSLTA